MAPMPMPITTPVGDRITTPRTLARDLRRSLEAHGERTGRPYAGDTLLDFVHACLQMGIGLNDPISSIEYGVAQFGTGCLTKERDDEKQGAWMIREMHS